MNFVPYFDNRIDLERQAIFLFKIWLVALVGAGILVILLSIFLGPAFPSFSSDLIKLGGAFVAILAVFPGKEIFPRKETIAKCLYFKQNFEHYGELSPEDQKLLKDYALQMMSR